MDIEERGWCDMDRIIQAKDGNCGELFVKEVMNLQVP
jgi:hypothetical protein